MGINEDGFLSGEIQAWVAKHRKENAEAFAIAGELSRLALRALQGAQPRSGDKRQLVVALLSIRLLTHFQAAVILAERGAVSSAKAMVRVMCEAVFSAGACVRDANFHEELAKDDRFRRADLIRALLAIPWKETGIPEEDLRKLAREADDLRKDAKTEAQQRLGPAVIARKAQLLDLYYLIYAPFSNAVHSSVRDLDSHYKAAAAGTPERIYFGPESAGVEGVVDAANQLLFGAVHFLLEVFPQPPVEQLVQALWERQKARLLKSTA